MDVAAGPMSDSSGAGKSIAETSMTSTGTCAETSM